MSRYHDHVGHMTYSNNYCICEGCGQMWKMGYRNPSYDEMVHGVTDKVRIGWQPDDPDYEYTDRPKPKNFRRKRR